jgi:hypothetical protein
MILQAIVETYKAMSQFSITKEDSNGLSHGINASAKKIRRLATKAVSHFLWCDEAN